MQRPPSTRQWLGFAAILVGAVALRAALFGVYFGHEEEDWSDPATVKGLLDSGWRYVELDHMPLYYWLAAAVTRVVGDELLACRLVSLFGGTLTVGFGGLLAIRALGAAWGLGVMAALAVQPELVLYSATALRELPYVGFLCVGAWALSMRAPVVAGVAFVLAFATRWFAGFLAIPALLLLGALEWRAGRRVGGYAVGLLLVLAATIAWAVYYDSQFGTYAFWASAVDRNTGDAVADLNRREYREAVTGALLGVVTRLSIGHLGPATLPLAVLGAVSAGRGPGDPDARRVIAVLGAGSFALVLTSAALTTYEWTHNMYWKWLTPSAALLLPLAAHGLRGAASWLGGLGRTVLVPGLLVATALTFATEGHAQFRQSRAWYAPQVLLADWASAHLSPPQAVLGEAIPATIVERRGGPHAHHWNEAEVPAGDALGEFLRDRRVALVFWFREEWTAAPEKAPGLGGDGPVRLGPVELIPVARADGYGFVGYRVEPELGPVELPHGLWETE